MSYSSSSFLTVMQVCGVFALFLSGAHNFIWWGLYCYPRLRVTAVTAYFATAGACVLIGLTAKSNIKRAMPMLVLLLLRFAVVLARVILNSGSWWASIHFLWMEVSKLYMSCAYSILLACRRDACCFAVLNPAEHICICGTSPEATTLC